MGVIVHVVRMPGVADQQPYGGWLCFVRFHGSERYELGNQDDARVFPCKEVAKEAFGQFLTRTPGAFSYTLYDADEGRPLAEVEFETAARAVVAAFIEQQRAQNAYNAARNALRCAMRSDELEEVPLFPCFVDGHVIDFRGGVYVVEPCRTFPLS